MNHTDLAPVTLMIEMRERLVRIETKMDSAADKADALQKVSDDHESRLAVLESNATQFRSSLRTLQWVGGGVVTIATIFGDKLVQLVQLVS